MERSTCFWSSLKLSYFTEKTRVEDIPFRYIFFLCLPDHAKNRNSKFPVKAQRYGGIRHSSQWRFRKITPEWERQLQRDTRQLDEIGSKVRSEGQTRNSWMHLNEGLIYDMMRKLIPKIIIIGQHVASTFLKIQRIEWWIHTTCCIEIILKMLNKTWIKK